MSEYMKVIMNKLDGLLPKVTVNVWSSITVEEQDQQTNAEL